MSDELNGKKIAILAADGFEQIELTEPRRVLEEAGASVFVVGPGPELQGMNHDDMGEVIAVDVELNLADPHAYDALMLPGGVRSPDRLRLDERAIHFVRSFFDVSKPVAAICHAPWLLIEAGAVMGRTITSYPSLETDLRNAGAQWVDRDVVVDKGLVTSRGPGDLAAFNRAMLKEFAEGTRAALEAEAAE